MSQYKQEYFKDLNEINQKIDNGLIEGPGNALELFEEYLKKIIFIGRFKSEIWKESWRKEVYKFGEKFQKTDPVDFLKIIKKSKENLSKDEEEVLDFFKSEIKVNNLTLEDCTNEINELIQKYPYNPEFRHNFGHFLKVEKEFLKAIEQYEFALKRDSNNNTFSKTLFNTQYNYIETLIDEGKYNEGLKYCNSIIEKETFKSSYVFSNVLVGLKERLKDYIILEKKILKAEENFKITVKEETEKERKRLIEILGFYSAIIAFIFSTVSIGKQFKFEEALIFIFCLGLILLIFLATINILFSEKEFKFKDPRLYIIIIFIFSLLIVLFKYTLPLWI